MITLNDLSYYFRSYNLYILYLIVVGIGFIFLHNLPDKVKTEKVIQPLYKTEESKKYKSFVHKITYSQLYTFLYTCGILILPLWRVNVWLERRDERRERRPPLTEAG